jgi:hypothetical protein
MAYSPNQNQFHLWGPHFLGLGQIQATPRLALKYWVAVQRRVMNIGNNSSRQLLMLNFDNLCAENQQELNRLFEFLEVPPSERDTAALRSLIQRPESIGRFQAFGVSHFDREDLQFVRDIGFPVS